MLIKESTLRRIIREEAQRVLKEEAKTYAIETIKAKSAELGAAGWNATQNTLGGYEYTVQQAENALRPIAADLEAADPRYVALMASFRRFYGQGNAHPNAQAVMSTLNNLKSTTTDPKAYLRCILLAMNDGGVYGRITNKGFSGEGLSGDDPATISKVNRAIEKVGDMEFLISNIRTIATYDLAGMMTAAATPGGPAAPTAPTAPAAPTAPTAPTAPAKARDWSSYIRLTPRGAEVKAAWDAYAASNALAPTDRTFFSFLHWWNKRMENKQYNKFDGSVEQTIAALNARTTAAPVAAKPSEPIEPVEKRFGASAQVGKLK